jgi:hypothetical protein
MTERALLVKVVGLSRPCRTTMIHTMCAERSGEAGGDVISQQVSNVNESSCLDFGVAYNIRACCEWALVRQARLNADQLVALPKSALINATPSLLLLCIL